MFLKCVKLENEKSFYFYYKIRNTNNQPQKLDNLLIFNKLETISQME